MRVRRFRSFGTIFTAARESRPLRLGCEYWAGSLRLIFLLGLFLGSDLSETRKILGFDLRRLAVFPANGVVDLFAMDADLFGGVDPQTHLVAADIHHGDLDVVSDHDRLVALTGQHQHTGSFLGKGPGSEIPNPRRREFQLARIVRAHHYTPADAVPWCESGDWP